MVNFRTGPFYPVQVDPNRDHGGVNGKLFRGSFFAQAVFKAVTQACVSDGYLVEYFFSFFDWM